MKEYNPHDAIDYIIHHAGEYAQAKANRMHIEEYRKSLKAILMGKSTESAANAREQYAYANPEYLTLLDGYKAAIEVEERLRWDLIAAQARVEVWRTEQANNRAQDRAMQ